MDGRTQLPVIEFLKKRFNVEYVDSITEPGPILYLDQQADQQTVQSILNRVDISVNKHGSPAIAVVGHHDCAGNPVKKDKQLVQIDGSVRFLRERYPEKEIIGLWVDENWEVEEL